VRGFCVPHQKHPAAAAAGGAGTLHGQKGRIDAYSGGIESCPVLEAKSFVPGTRKSSHTKLWGDGRESTGLTTEGGAEGRGGISEIGGLILAIGHGSGMH
jgi:hypothetical protein